MATVWFVLVALMAAVYVLLDGFDLGAGALHLAVARTPAERRQVLRAIGPVWDGNEVWLIAAGGALFCAFPRLYAAGFSGFYLPLFIVLWLLMLRAVAIEFHHRVHHEMWAGFWDAVFFAASAVLIIFFGAALGNVVRGVPLDGAGFFSEPLWTTFSPIGSSPGILDWFTVTIGLLALSTLCQHGAAFLALRTDGPVNARARRLARGAWIATIALSVLATLEMLVVRPTFLSFVESHALEVVFPLLAIAGIAGAGYALARGRDGLALIGSGAFIAGMLTSTVFSLYPTVLPAVHASNSLTIDNASSSTYGLSAALHWWPLAMILAACYFVAIYWLFRGKVRLEGTDGGAYAEPVTAVAPPTSPSIPESERLPVGSP